MINLQTDYSPVYELLSSLTVFTNKNNYYDLGKNWVKKIRNNIADEEFLSEMEDSNDFLCLGYIYILIWKSPKKDSIESFIEWLENLSPGQIYEFLSPYLSEGLPVELGEFRDYYVTIFQKWNKHYSFDRHNLNLLEKTSEKVKSTIGKNNPIKLIEDLTNGLHFIPDETTDTFVLIPSYHSAPMNRVFFLNSTVIVCYSVDLPPTDLSLPPVQLSRITRALGDEKRLQILRIVSSGPHTFKEIASELKLTKGNLHYHLTLLRIAGLIRVINNFAQTHDTYELRKEVLTKVSDGLLKYVIPPLKRL